MNKTAAVAVVGLGYVGLPLALLADRKGYNVFGVDTDDAKIEAFARSGELKIDGVSAADLAAARITFTTDFSKIRDAGIVIICVPTPVDEYLHPDLSPVRDASASVGAHLQPGQLVVLESTVNPGVSETIVLPILEQASGLKGGIDFQLAHCPERINPGDRSWNVSNIPRVIGALEPTGLARAVGFYTSIIDGEIRPMGSLQEAEAVKVVENSFRDINIAFVNELAMSFDKLGINVVNVIQGASTKPFAFMPHAPGCGVGGHCIPVDPYYLIEYARDHGYQHRLLAKARTINRQMPGYTAKLTADLLAQAGLDIKTSTVAVLGIAYKPDVADARESPAHHIMAALRHMGAKVVAYDPYVSPVALAVASGPRRSAVPSTEPLAAAVSGADAVVVATGHQMFKDMDPGLLHQAGVKVVIDGRNCLNRDGIESLGMRYKGIGF